MQLFKPRSENGKGPPNTMIVVEATKRRILRCVPEKFIPKDSFARDYGNLFLHTLGLDLKGTFWPIVPNQKQMDNESPIDFFMAKHCAPEVEEVYGLSMPTSEKIKLGIFLGICIAIIIMIFLIATTSGGNTIG